MVGELRCNSNHTESVFILHELFHHFNFITTFTNESWTLNHNPMSIFGIVLFLLIGGMAFWMLLFLLGFIVPYWIHLGVMQQLRPKKVFEKDEEEAN